MSRIGGKVTEVDPQYRLQGKHVVRMLLRAARLFTKTGNSTHEEYLYSCALGYTRLFDRTHNARRGETHDTFRERIVLKLRSRGMTWKEIGEVFEVSASRARQYLKVRS